MMVENEEKQSLKKRRVVTNRQIVLQKVNANLNFHQLYWDDCPVLPSQPHSALSKQDCIVLSCLFNGILNKIISVAFFLW